MTIAPWLHDELSESVQWLWFDGSTWPARRVDKMCGSHPFATRPKPEVCTHGLTGLGSCVCAFIPQPLTIAFKTSKDQPSGIIPALSEGPQVEACHQTNSQQQPVEGSSHSLCKSLSPVIVMSGCLNVASPTPCCKPGSLKPEPLNAGDRMPRLRTKSWTAWWASCRLR